MLIVEMKKHFQLRALEWWSAGLMASWGFYSLLRPGMFAENPAMGLMLTLAPQHIWALGAFLVGGIRLVALTINGFWYRTPAVRWLMSMLSILVWFCITASLFRSPVANPGVVVYGWHMIADIYSAFRAASDFVEAEAQRRLRELQVTEFSGGESNVRSLVRK